MSLPDVNSRQIHPEDVQRLLEALTLLDIRLRKCSAELHFDAPVDFDAVRLNFGTTLFRVVEDQLECRFDLTATLVDEEDDLVATVETSHVAAFGVSSPEDLDEDVVPTFMDTNVFFMVYPYIRQSVYELTSSIGMGPVLLGVLGREDHRPEKIAIHETRTGIRVLEQPATGELVDEEPESDVLERPSSDD